MLREYFSIVRVSESSKGFKITLPYKTNTTYDGRGDCFPQNRPISRIARIVLSIPVFEVGARMAPASICGPQLGRHICVSHLHEQKQKQIVQSIDMGEIYLTIQRRLQAIECKRLETRSVRTTAPHDFIKRLIGNKG
jgi:hypothetical protein